jgi:hypothetical protein
MVDNWTSVERSVIIGDSELGRRCSANRSFVLLNLVHNSVFHSVVYLSSKLCVCIKLFLLGSTLSLPATSRYAITIAKIDPSAQFAINEPLDAYWRIASSTKSSAMPFTLIS